MVIAEVNNVLLLDYPDPDSPILTFASIKLIHVGTRPQSHWWDQYSIGV